MRDELFTYRGQRDFFGKPDGRGEAVLAGGQDRFEGEFRQGGREGRGVLIR